MWNQRKVKIMDKKVHFSFEYADDSEWNFEGTFEGKESEISASVMMVTRGTLMVSTAIKGTAYRQDGFPICQYVK